MPKMEKVSVLIVDRDREFRHSIKILLQLYNKTRIFDLYLIGETSSFEEGLNLLKKYKPNLVLLGLELNQKKDDLGLEILKNAKTISQVIVLSNQQEGEIIFQAMKFRAWGVHIQKKCSKSTLRSYYYSIEFGSLFSCRSRCVFFRLL